MDLELADKVAVVTGASKGIGLAATRALVDEGAHVVAGARSTESLDGLDRVTTVAVDLAVPDGPALLIERAIQQHGRVDVLVNNVGAVRLRLEGFLGTSDDDFAWAMEMNFFAALRRSADLTRPSPTETPSGSPSTAAPSTPDYDKTLQPVTIANGTNVAGRSNPIAALFADAGYTKITRIQAQPQAKTTVYYGPGFADVAADIAATFGLPATRVQPAAGVQGVQFYAGEDFTTGTKPAPSAQDPGSVVGDIFPPLQVARMDEDHVMARAL